MRPFLVIFCLMAAGCREACAHELRPAYLELRETAADRYEMLWKVPARGRHQRLALYVRFPQECRVDGAPHSFYRPGAFVETATVRCREGLAGKEITIDGLTSTFTDVLVRIEHMDGTTQVTRLTPSSPSFRVTAAPGVVEVATTYLTLGVEHILRGIDHLLFVLALMMITRGTWLLIKTITAFTIAHSITLALATLGFVTVPTGPVEATIALSIVFVATEIVHVNQGRPSLTARAPWIVAFAFGLLHGFGFAGALSQIGLPQASIPAGLLFFNLGVEVGQILFVASLLAAFFSVRQVVDLTARAKFAAVPTTGFHPLRRSGVPHVRVLAGYVIGSTASFWTIERVSNLW